MGSLFNYELTKPSSVAQQCLDRRIPSVEKLSSELTAWQKERNHTTSKVVWQFTPEDARLKFKHLDPVFESSERGF